MPGYNTADQQKVGIEYLFSTPSTTLFRAFRNLNGQNGDTTFVSSSHSKFICLNSTFEDEDVVFNAIVNSKMHHVKKKYDQLREGPHISKQIKTIDEESLKEANFEEIKSEIGRNEVAQDNYDTKKAGIQDNETIDFGFNAR